MALVSTSDGRWGVLRNGRLRVQGQDRTFIDIAQSDNGRIFANTFSSLYRLNRSGESKFIGSFGASGMNSLGFDANGRLFGASDNGGFYQINQRTGEARLLFTTQGFASSGDLVFDPAKNRFFLTARRSGTDVLLSIRRNGSFSLVGDVGYSNVFGLALDGRNLFGYTAQNQEILINKNTGVGRFRQNVRGTIGQIYGAT
ncbi:MAG: hypothetical protein WBA43_09890 [Elainellaceae cyanobacterium]|jgi:hypothetical protein